MIKKLFVSSILIFLFAVNGYAQSSVDSLEYLQIGPAANILFSNYDKQLNTTYLNTGFNLKGDFSPVVLQVNENFRSSIFRTSTTSIRDEQYLSLSGKYKFNRKINLGIAASSSILSDDRNIQLNQTKINYVTLFSGIEVLRNVYISPFGGYSNNEQLGEFDNGPVYGIEGVMRNFLFTNFIINSQFRYRNEDIFPRRNLLRFFNISVTNPFNPSVTNYIEGRYSSSRKDFYFPADSITSGEFDIVNNIESRTESIFSAYDRIVSDNIFTNFSLELMGGLNWRTIDRNKRYKTTELQSPKIFDTKIEELILSFQSTLYYRTVSFDASLGLTFAERDEKNITKPFEGVDQIFFEQRSEQESRKNNNSTRTTLALRGRYKISETDKFIFSLYQSKLRYDAPSEDNDDDRDELLSIVRLRYSKYLSPFFEAFINAEGTYSHVVYLFASRSSNNNVNRVLSLSLGGYYRGKNVSSLNRFEVSANYTVYDFEDLASSLRSFAFRQLTATDSSRVNLSRRFAFVITGYVKLSEQGDLNWGDFAERPTRFFQEIFTDPKLLLTYNDAYFAIGARYFSLNTFNYEGQTRIPDTRYLSIGPLAELLYNVYSNLYLKITGWYEFITINNTQTREQSNLIMALNWSF